MKCQKDINQLNTNLMDKRNLEFMQKYNDSHYMTTYESHQLIASVTKSIFKY